MSYHNFSNFHQAPPIKTQINKYNTLVTNPIYHQSLVFIYPAPKNIGELLKPKCVNPADKVDKKLRISAASAPGTPALTSKTKNVGNNTVI